MEKIKINLPGHYNFETEIPVLIQHMNHGNHLGNESYLSITNEARVRFFKALGVHDLDIGENISIVISSTIVKYMQQVYYGETLKVQIAFTGYEKSEFELIFKMSKKKDGSEVARMLARLVCIENENNKVVDVPGSFLGKINE